MSQYRTAAGLILALILLIPALHALVPPHPLYREVPVAYTRTVVERGSAAPGKSSREIPNNILVLRVDFPDQPFQTVPSFPDDLAHDDAFFDRSMIHLADFFSDASKGQYSLQYTLWENVFTMSQPAGYYGADTSERVDARVPQMIMELVQMADPEINFSQYGGIIVFHSGAGQEADIQRLRTDSIWSTFLTRRNLQNALDPENDDYQGIPTSDGTFIKNVVIVPESQWHDYFPLPPDPMAYQYIFSIYGVLAHQFGHLIGLPTLFDNVSSNGQSQGVGNWCLMGTGVWNANGYVPAQLSAWNRYYLGWDIPYTVTESMENLIVDHFLNPEPQYPTIYKLPISAQEYFLVENRQQNPDGSLDPYNGQPSYSFKLLPEGIQQYYEDAPLRPFFDFMQNRYKGSEWDFMLPGLGGPLRPGETQPVDGSGILIWHIDENIMNEFFDPDFEINRPNGNAAHKAVDLEEADGIQHLDTALFDYYMYGGPYDAFRAGNNDYFGNAIHNGLLSLPTAESYYGGIPLEVYNISASANQMSFSVRMDWRLDALYEGENPINAAWIDLDGDGLLELFHPMPDGRLYAWKNENLAEGFPVRADSLAYNYTSDGYSVYLPLQVQNLARMRKLTDSSLQTVFNMIDYYWAAQPIDIGDDLIVCFNPASGSGTEIYAVDKENNAIFFLKALDSVVEGNLAYRDEELWALSRESQNYRLHRYHLSTGVYRQNELAIPSDSTLVGIFLARLNPASGQDNLIVQLGKSLWVYSTGDSPTLHSGFPFIHDEVATAPLSLGDLDKNGRLDIILPYANGIFVLDHAGALVGNARLSNPDPAAQRSSSALVVDIDGDGFPELLGSFSRNRMAAWNHRMQLKPGYPISFSGASSLQPIIGPASDGDFYAWLATDNGKIFRKKLPGFSPAALDSIWIAEYGSLARKASLDFGNLPNQFSGTNVFVPSEVYIYPNPLKPIFGDTIRLNVMTTVDTPLELRIYDISGILIYRQSASAKAYLRNREIFSIPASRMSSGVYIAVVSSPTSSLRLRFAVEK